jgi:hypothetical protein
MAGGRTLQQLEKNSLLKKRTECLCLRGLNYCDSLASGKGCGQCYDPVISQDMCDLPKNSG